MYVYVYVRRQGGECRREAMKKNVEMIMSPNAILFSFLYSTFYSYKKNGAEISFTRIEERQKRERNETLSIAKMKLFFHFPAVLMDLKEKNCVWQKSSSSFSTFRTVNRRVICV